MNARLYPMRPKQIKISYLLPLMVLSISRWRVWFLC